MVSRLTGHAQLVLCALQDYTQTEGRNRGAGSLDVSIHPSGSADVALSAQRGL